MSSKENPRLEARIGVGNGETRRGALTKLKQLRGAETMITDVSRRDKGVEGRPRSGN